jgi:hypothetical protein
VSAAVNSSTTSAPASPATHTWSPKTSRPRCPARSTSYAHRLGPTPGWPEEKTAEADTLEAEIETAQPHAYICGGCKSRLPADMRGPWSPVGAWYLALPMGGRLSVKPGSQAEADTIARTLAALPPLYLEPAPAGA